MKQELVVACQDLVAVTKEGKRSKISIRIGVPRESAPDEWICPVQVEGLSDLTEIEGWSSLHSLCMAAMVARRVLKMFVARGGQLLDLNSKDAFDIQAHFALYANEISLTGQPKRRRRWKWPSIDWPSVRRVLLSFVPSIDRAAVLKGLMSLVAVALLGVLAFAGLQSDRTLTYRLYQGQSIDCVVRINRLTGSARLLTDTQRCRVATGVRM